MPLLAYYLDRFPALSETFVRREVRAIQALGLRPMLVSNQRPDDREMHPEDRFLARTVWYLYPSAKKLAPLFLAGVFGRPFDLIRGLGRALFLGPISRIPHHLGRLALATVLNEGFERRGVGHVHIHFAFGAAETALFLPPGRPSYSLSIHGSDVLSPMPHLEEKLAGARFIASNCQYHVDRLIGLYPRLNPARFHVIRLGIDLESPNWSPAGPPPAGPPFRILSVGRLVPVKAHEILIRAVGRMVEQGLDVLCRIVGDGPRRDELAGLIGQLGLAGRVDLLGPRFEDDISRLLADSHVLALSSKSEGTPMTLIEAMARGRAVVAPRITAIPEMVDDGRTGYLFHPEDETDLARKLALLARDPGSTEAMGAAGRVKAEELFDLKKNAARLAELFRQVMDQREPS